MVGNIAAYLAAIAPAGKQRLHPIPGAMICVLLMFNGSTHTLTCTMHACIQPVTDKHCSGRICCSTNAAVHCTLYLGGAASHAIGYSKASCAAKAWAWALCLGVFQPRLPCISLCVLCQVEMAFNPAAIVSETSPSQLLLLVLANGLMVPRAVLARQVMWFTGTCSGTLLALGQLLMLGLHSLCAGLQLPMLAPPGGVDSQAFYLPVSVLLQAQLGSRVGTSCVITGMPGVTVVALIVWLWLSAAVLQHGWHCIQANQPVPQ